MENEKGITQYFGANLAELLSCKICAVYKDFNKKAYVDAISNQFAPLGYTQRIELHAEELHNYLPDDFKQASEILVSILGEENKNETGMFCEKPMQKEKIKMNSVEIYFFSGTGNTLFLVKELKKRIPEAVLIPIAALKYDSVVIPQSKNIGFCFPNHGGQIPAAMKLFIRKLKLKGDEYLFALVSSGGTGCNAFETINRIAAKKSLRLSGEFLINVPSFNPKTDDISTLPSDEQVEDFKRTVPGKLDRMSEAVKQHRTLVDIDAPPYQLPLIIEKFLAPLVLNIAAHSASFYKKYFYADSNCTGCGICEKVCQTERISIQDGRPQWNIKTPCYCCHACLAFCPVGAIQVKAKLKWAGSKTKENPRFKPPFASAGDIGRQRNERDYDV